MLQLRLRLNPHLSRAVAEIRETRLFDAAWYTERYPDTTDLDPLLHYVVHGEAEGRLPNPLFDPAFYRSRTEVPEGRTALGHFASTGWKHGIAPHPLFDMTYYRERYPDVRGNPLVHFLERGEAQGYDPHPLFHTNYYVAQLAQSVARPVAHFLRNPAVSPYPLFDAAWYGGSLVDYLTTACEDGRDPHPLFSTKYYIRRYGTMLQGMNPLVHYAKTGGVIALQPHALFDPACYAAQRPDAAKTGYPMLIAYLEADGSANPHPLFDPEFYREQAGSAAEPPLVHYIRHGDRLGFWPNRLFDTSFYKSRHSDLQAMTALEHYIEHCFEADPHPSFSTEAYMSRRPALAPGQTPLEHYLLTGGPLPEPGVAVVRATFGTADLQRQFNEGSELICTQPMQTDDGVIAALREILTRDPMFGCVAPRLSHDGAVLSLDGSDHLPPHVLDTAPEFYILPETISPCWLFRAEALQNAPPPDDSFRTADGALYHLLYRMRRTGYRCVVANRIVVPIDTPPGQSAEVAGDIHRLSTVHPDNLRARQEFAKHPAHRHEALLAQKRTLLLDGRGIPVGYNGTSEFALGLLDGIEAARHDWHITLLVNTGVDEFHGLSARYARMRVTTSAQDAFAVAVRLSQPWYPDTLHDVHRRALFSVHFVYDTIAWDTVYPAPENLSETWGLLAQHSDALIYISDFTRRRFRMRFPVASAVRELVCYPSLDACDYATAAPENGGYLLVAGNEYDHKGVADCAARLTAAFPELEVRTMTRAIGAIPQTDMEQMYARASAVVFPSFYEGFGFPVVRAMAYGKTVFARSSELLDELMGLYRGPGRVVEFGTSAELTDAVREFLHGRQRGKEGRGSVQHGWGASARALLEFLEQMTGDSRWLERESAFRQMAAWK